MEEAPTPFTEKNFSTEIDNNKTEFKLSSSENILSISTELNNKKYRLTISTEELKESNNFFKQFSTFDDLLKAVQKIITTTKNIIIKDNFIEIKFKNFFDEDNSIKIPEEKNINLLYLNLKKLQI